MHLLVFLGAITALAALKAKGDNSVAHAMLMQGAGITPTIQAPSSVQTIANQSYHATPATTAAVPNSGSLLVLNPVSGGSSGSGSTSTNSPGTSSGGGTTGSGGNSNPTPACFSGGVMIKTPIGPRSIEALPRYGEFWLQNLTGTHRAVISGVHEHNGPAIEIERDKYVTPTHPMGQDGKTPATSFYEGHQVHHFIGKVYDITVMSDKPEDKHFVLWNGDVAHNKPICC
jgi:hypothetical protein